ncbi:MAG: SPOR domain-containing protein [Pseudomonadota bacterium]
MAHPQHAKTPKLNALLIGKRTVPSGCRVLNVSQQGMSLQCDPDGRLLTFINGDTVDIYLSVQHINGHNKFTIPAIVSHVDESTIDVVFHCTDPELAGLIESYRTSKSHNLEASIDHRQAGRKESTVKPVAANESVSYNAQTKGPTSQSSRSFYSGLFALFITTLVLLGAYYYISSINKRLNTLETASRSHTDELAEVQTQVFSSRLQDGRYASLNARMKALTDAFQSFEKRVTQTLPQEPVIVATAAPEPVREAAPREARKPTVGTPKPQTEARKKATAPVEKKPKTASPAKEAHVVMAEKQTIEEPDTPSLQKYPAIKTQATAPAATTPAQTVPKAAPSATSQDKPDKTGTKQTPAIKQGPAARPAAPPVVPPVATPTRTEKPATARTGPWVINLLSSTDKAYVEKAMADIQSKGFNVVIKSATVKGRQYWRLQAPGFGSMAKAKTAAEPIKEQLKIKDVWIFKR